MTKMCAIRLAKAHDALVCAVGCDTQNMDTDRALNNMRCRLQILAYQGGYEIRSHGSGPPRVVRVVKVPD